MAPPRKIVLEQASSHETFHKAQFTILVLAVITTAVFIIVCALNDQQSTEGDLGTGTSLFRLVVSLGVLGLTMLLINYYQSSSKTLYVIKILSHLGALGLVIASSVELSDKLQAGGAEDSFHTSMVTFAGLSIALVGLGTLFGIINASHEFAFLF